MSVRVRVAAGRVVRDPRGRKCPDGEFSVDEKDFFWAGCLRSGDVVRVDPKAPAAIPAVTVTAEKKAESK
ncbi:MULTISPECIES: DUF2635 domain-containing protein [Acetobacter]|uniref:DUF2635 domain-containing protein n=1 Tax=Acetobacter TaxID=434 RepID=UPI001BACA27C|nr:MULTISPECIES: DUF2635 domain-containing protein [Acetobacter]MBS1016921.1 hypothetical protein [Acetobacter persici]MCP1270901.1 DUF2635 domain-containing protein [Acetobacter cerevisiae]MCP1278868.1 DUF2635 domain-containing protein [Acetobacter cerevisiae]